MQFDCNYERNKSNMFEEERKKERKEVDSE